MVSQDSKSVIPHPLIDNESPSRPSSDSNDNKEPVKKPTLKTSMSFNTKCSATLKQMLTDPDAPKTKLDKYMDLLVPAGVGLSSTSMLVKKCKQDDDSEDDSKTDKANFHFDNVVAPEKRKNNNGKDIGGCPKDEFMGKLTVQCYKCYKSGLKPDIKGYRAP